MRLTGLAHNICVCANILPLTLPRADSSADMHFNVSGPQATGVVFVHMTKGRTDSKFDYYSLALDVPGQERLWVENVEQGKLDNRTHGKMFGVRWW